MLPGDFPIVPPSRRATPAATPDLSRTPSASPLFPLSVKPARNGAPGSTDGEAVILALRHRVLPIWGVQFHPEVTPLIVERWAEGNDPEREQQVLSILTARQGELHRAWEALLRRFARIALED